MKEFSRPEISDTDKQLEGLLMYKNPKAAEIMETVRETMLNRNSGHDCNVPYSRNLLEGLRGEEDIKGRLKELLTDHQLVDLGGGDNPVYAQEMATEFGVKLLIDVEYHLHQGEGFEQKQLPYSLIKDVSKEMQLVQKPGTTVAMVRADMLDFASKLKTGSVNFTINGIDKIIIAEDEYHRLLADEIARATMPGGVVFGVSSEVIGNLAERPDFESVVDKGLIFDVDKSRVIGCNGILIKREDIV